MIFNPLEEYEKNFKSLHLEKTKELLENLVKQSNIDIEENRKTIKEIEETENIKKTKKKKLGWWKFLRVILFITLILIPLAIIKINPIIKGIKNDIEELARTKVKLQELATSQMKPLNRLFDKKFCLDLIESVVPNIKFDKNFTLNQERFMVNEFDFKEKTSDDQSTINSLAGCYNENPFLFERRTIQYMGTEIYHGYRTIFWTETYRDSNGRFRTRTRSQTLHATVAKPKPEYTEKVLLSYCCQAGPELSFSREAGNVDEKSERQIERHIKKGEKNLKKLTDKAVKDNQNFVSMSNTEFEVLFNAMNRTNEVQFRTLFTPLAQTNMVDLLLDKEQYGDDFSFIKNKRTSRIISDHSQGRTLVLYPNVFYSNSYDEIEKNFIEKNQKFFEDVYFDFAPLLSIPIYQEKPMKGLEEYPDLNRQYSYKEYEVLANKLDEKLIMHEESKTKQIIKCRTIRSNNDVDKIVVTAHSFDFIQHTDLIPVFGGDGRVHNVPVVWKEYIPIEQETEFNVSTKELAEGKDILAEHNDLCIF